MRTKPSFLVLWMAACMLCCYAAALKAQVQVAVTMAPPYPTHVEDVMQLEGQVVLSLLNQSGQPRQIKLLSTIEGNNGVMIRTKESYQPATPLLLTIGQTLVLTGAQLRALNSNLTENDLEITGVSRSQLIQTEQLPEGVYTICVRAYDYFTGQLLSPIGSGCTTISITWFDPPFLTSPEQEAYCPPKTPQFQMFTWTPAGQPGKTRYRFELVDMTLNQLANPNDAFLNPATLPVFQQEGLVAPSLAYDLAKPALVKDHRYAWRVTAYDPAKSISFKNNGHSEVWAFRYAHPLQGPGDLTNTPDPGPNPVIPPGPGNLSQTLPEPVMQYGPPCGDKACSPALPPGPAVTEGLAPGGKVSLGHFELELVTMQWNGAKINGTGRVYVPMFKGRLAVDVKDLEVNAQGKAIAGKAVALYDLGANVAEALKSYANGMEGVTPQMIQQIHTQVENGKKYVKDSLGTDAKLPFALAKEKLQQLQLIHITAVEFKTDGARFNAFMKVDIPETNSVMGFGAKNICFHPQGLSGQSIDQLHLVGSSLKMPFGDKVELTLRGEGPQGGTYISWDCSGYQEMQLEGDFAFQSNMLVPMNPNLDKVRATFALKAALWGDMLGAVAFDSFYVAGFRRLEFRALDAVVDFSDFANPQGIKFPEAYIGNKDNTWRGFYLKTIELTLPEYLRRGKSDVELTMKDCIINKQGFTGKVTLEPLFAIEEGSVGKWQFSIDKIQVGLVNNSLVNSSFDGKILVPIAKTGIGYHCALSGIGGDLSTEFGIANTDSINVSMWIARMHLAPGSSISVKVEGKQVVCKTDFTGSLNVKGEFKDLPSVDLQIPDVQFSHLIVSNGPPYLSCASFALASPQKSLNGFNISFNPAKAPPQFKDMLGVKLESQGDTCNLSFGFMISLHDSGSGNGISGFSNLTIHSKLYTQNGMRWEYEKTRLNSIAVDATMAVVRIKGKVEFFYGDNKTYGKGFRGNFEVTFKPTFYANATVQFGKVNGFKYWFVDANARFTPGVAMGPAIALYGFGGGAYYHMSPDTTTLPAVGAFKGEQAPPNKPFQVQAMGASSSGTVYVPDQNIKFGFKASVVIGTFPSPRPFNGDVFLEANFNPNGGLNMIQLGVDAYFMSDVTDRKDPKVFGKGLIAYKEQGGQRMFDATFELFISVKAKNTTVLSGNGLLSIHVESEGMEGEGGKWWVLLGAPDQRVNIAVAGALKVGSYLMLGNEIPGPPPLPAEFLVHLPNFKHSRVADGDVSGFGFGSEYRFDQNFKFLIFYAELKMILGFDVFLIDSKAMSCPDYPKPGINGFYATGQMYAGFDAAVGLDINVWFLKARFEIFHAYIYAGLKAGLPNPTWVMGEIAGGFEIFNGLAKGEFHLFFKAGDICDESANDPFGGLKIIADIAPNTEKSSVFSVPEIAFNADLGKEVTVKTYSEKGEKIHYYRFHIQDVQVRRLREMKNGKMTNLAQPETLPGAVQLIQPRMAQVEMENTFKGLSEYEVTVRVWGERKEGNKWVAINDEKTKQKYFEVKKQKFTTDKTPNKFVDENIAYTYPHRMQRYFYTGDVKTGVVQFEQGIDLFDVTPVSNAYQYKFIARFTRIKNGLFVTAETPLFYDKIQERVTFSIPNLMKEQVYMLQFMAVMEKKPGQWLAGSPPASSGSQLITDVSQQNWKKDNSYLNTSVQTSRIEGVTLVGQNEHELYRMFFRTSKYSSIKHKWEDYDLQSQNLGAGDFERRLTGNYNGKEPWGKYDLLPYSYVYGTVNVQSIPALLTPILEPSVVQQGQVVQTDLIGQIYLQFYQHVRKFLYGGNAPCTEDQLSYDWEHIMAQSSKRIQPSAQAYPSNSTALSGRTFSDLEGARRAVGLRYTGNGPTQLQMQEVTSAYGSGGGNIQNLSLAPPPPAQYTNSMQAIWDFAHMSYYAREDFYDFLGSRGNMGICENGFRDNFLTNYHPKDYAMKFKKTNTLYRYMLNYQLPEGAEGSAPSFNTQSLKY